MTNAVLQVKDLSVTFNTPEGEVKAVAGLNFSLMARQTLGIVGESGSGKSQTAFAMLGLLAKNGRATGSIVFDGQEILNMPQKFLNRLRGKEIAIIFQDPMTSLNPYLKIKDQLIEVLRFHKGMSQKDALSRAWQMLEAVKIPEAKRRLNMYPHELSGGMRQRVVIAMALLCNPKLLICDEPTTALDVTVQAQIMTLLDELKTEFGTSIIAITHDLGVVAGSCDRVLVMYAGQTMAYGAVDDIFYNPLHPYTVGLLGAIAPLDKDVPRLPTIAGNPPNLLSLPKGCPFAPRCQLVDDVCQEPAPLTYLKNNRARACHMSQDVVQAYAKETLYGR